MSEQVQSVVYKICPRPTWVAAAAAGHYGGSADDVRDGFIHLSTWAQLDGTLAKHFAGQTDLVLIAFEAGALGAALRWEVSRGGDRFPHVYGTLDPEQAIGLWPIELDADGIPYPPVMAAAHLVARREEQS